jgi:hypothetical protein
MDNDKPTFSLLRRLGRKTPESEKAALQQQNGNEKPTDPLELKPAMPELGTAPCLRAQGRRFCDPHQAAIH